MKGKMIKTQWIISVISIKYAYSPFLKEKKWIDKEWKNNFYSENLEKKIWNFFKSLIEILSQWDLTNSQNF